MKQKGHRYNDIQEQPLDFSVKPLSLSQSHYALSETEENTPVSVLLLRRGSCAKDIPTYVIWDFKEQIFLSSSELDVFCLAPV